MPDNVEAPMKPLHHEREAMPQSTDKYPPTLDPSVARLAREVEALNHRLARLDWLAYLGFVVAISVFLMTAFSLAMHSLSIW